MTDTIISVRIDKKVHERMKELDYINWSAVIRRTVEQHLEELRKEKKFDKERARQASQDIDKIRKSGIFDGGKSSVEIIREWRDKRKF